MSQPAVNPVQRARVHLARAKAADDLGDTEEAMLQCKAAEALRRPVLPLRCGGVRGRDQRLIAHFTPELIDAAVGPSDPTRVLILGMPRSGTTLAEQIISSHPDVHGGGELPFWAGRGAAWEIEGRPGPGSAFLEQAAQDYLALLRSLAPDAARVTDKMPLNVLWAGLIHVALPGATIIHCRRHPVATALSIQRTHFNPHLAFPAGGDDLVAYFRGYEALSAHWRRVLPAGRYIELDYEALTGAPEREIRRLIGAMGIVWNDMCLLPECNRRVVRTPSKWQARQPITDAGAQSWRAYEHCLGPLGALLDGSLPADGASGEAIACQ